MFGGVKQIGDDGKNGSVSYLVKRSVTIEVKKASKANQYYKGDLSENDLVIHIPTGNILESVRQSYDDTKDSMKENGGHSVQGNNSAIRWDEGPAATADIDKNGNTVVRATLHMFVVNGINTMPHDASNIQLWWHTHPNVTINGVSLGSSNPSEADYNGQRKMLNRGYNGNSFVIGVRDRRVTFFNGKKTFVNNPLESVYKNGRTEKMKRLLFVLLVLLFTLNACSVAYHSCIRLNNRLTSRTLDKCYRNNKNAFSLSSTYADFSVVWSYGTANIEVYRIKKGRVTTKNKYLDNDIKNIPGCTLNNIEQIVYDECTPILDGDVMTFVFDRDGKKQKIVLPVEINCFKQACFKSSFLNEVVKDIKKYELWEIYETQKE